MSETTDALWLAFVHAHPRAAGTIAMRLPLRSDALETLIGFVVDYTHADDDEYGPDAEMR